MISQQKLQDLRLRLLGMDAPRLHDDPEWERYCNAIVTALEPYLEAKIAVLRTLAEYEERLYGASKGCGQ